MFDDDKNRYNLFIFTAFMTLLVIIVYFLKLNLVL